MSPAEIERELHPAIECTIIVYVKEYRFHRKNPECVSWGYGGGAGHTP